MKNVDDNKLFSQKIAAWQTVLEEVRLENIRLKNLLAEAISKNVSRQFVEQAEIFQQKFLDKDQVIDLLRHEISSLLTGNVDVLKNGSQINSMEKDISRLQAETGLLKTIFYQYLESRSE
jgi:hypothetical protein